MNARTSTPYYDRKTGTLREDPIYAAGFLDWCYNSHAGWFVTEYLLSRPVVSRLYGWFNQRWWTRGKITRFAAQLRVDIDEATRPLAAYKSFNDFFTRDIDLARRPIAADPDVCVAPADGRIFAFPTIDPEEPVPVKRATLSLPALLRDDMLAREFSGGGMLISRLYLADYHHFHFPDSGVPGTAHAIGRRCYSVTPYARTRNVPYFAENRRMVSLFESDHFGRIAIVEVGSFTVGSIQQRYEPGVRVVRGAHKGFFEIGGSVVILVFKKGAITFDEDLCRNTAAGYETYVRLGESIGVAARDPAEAISGERQSGARERAPRSATDPTTASDRNSSSRHRG